MSELIYLDINITNMISGPTVIHSLCISRVKDILILEQSHLSDLVWVSICFHLEICWRIVFSLNKSKYIQVQTDFFFFLYSMLTSIEQILLETETSLTLLNYTEHNSTRI